MKNFLRHLSSLIAPVTSVIILPYLILLDQYAGTRQAWFPPPLALRVLGLLVGLAGLILAVLTIRMFMRISQGTIMPWDPSRRLITGSLYAHVRNPMILSLLVLMVGEALLFASAGIAILAAVFFVVNSVYFIMSEEPGLEKRFGHEYAEYKANVPRWLPRLKPWKPENLKTQKKCDNPRLKGQTPE